MQIADTTMDFGAAYGPLYWLLTREIKERFKVFELICAFMEDFSETQNNVGKGFIKIDAQENAGLPLRERELLWFTQLLSLYECIHKTSLSLGVEHLNFSSTISHSLNRQFRDVSRDVQRKVASTSQNIQSQLDTINKERVSYAKKYAKYVAVADKCDTLLADLKKEDSATPAGDGGFISRLTHHGKDRAACLKLCSDYDTLEQQLARSAGLINDRREALQRALVEAANECKEVELGKRPMTSHMRYLTDLLSVVRLRYMRENLQAFADAFAFITGKFTTLNQTLNAEVDAIDRDFSTVRIPGSGTDAADIFGAASDFQRFLDVLDALKAFCARASSFVSDVSDSERTAAKATQKYLEKHGYAKTTSTTFGLARNTTTNKYNTTLACLISTDSPAVSSGWESAVKAYGALSEGHFMTSEVYATKVLQAIENPSKRLQVYRKTLIDKQAASNKISDKTRAQILKLNQQLVKVQKDMQILRDEPVEHETDESKPAKRSLGLEQISTKLISSRLGVAVGLESETDRSSRINKQLEALQQEEKSLAAQIKTAESGEKLYNDTIKEDVDALLKSTEDTIATEVRALKTAFRHITDWSISALEPFQIGLADVKSSLMEIDTDTDFLAFIESIRRAADSETYKDLIINLPAVAFEKLKRVAIEEEIKKNGLQSAADLQLGVLSDGEVSDDEDAPARVSPTVKATPEKATSGRMNAIESSFNKPAEPVQVRKDSLETVQVNDLAIFGLDTTDKVLEVFSCALYPNSGLISQGRLFITQRYMAFAGFGTSWEGVRILLALKDLTKIEKTNMMVIIPTALQITDSSNEEYFFGSFLDRDSCYSMLSNMSQAEKQLIKMDGAAVDKRNLVLGYQTARPGIVEPAKPPTTITAEPVAKQQPAPPVREPVKDPIHTPAVNVTTSVPEPAPQSVNEGMVTPPAKTAPQVSSEPEVAVPDVANIDISSWFKTNGISLLHEETIPFSVRAVYDACWLDADGYGDFLVGEGDVGLSYDEWEQNLVAPVEDATNSSYSYTRNFVFEHPRTTMLFIGPENAPAKQVQHLFCGGKTFPLEIWKPKQVVLTMVTKFEGFPFANTFKVVQYWTVSPGTTPSESIIRLGVRLHFITQTMFRGQIIAGTESELVKQAKRWIAYCVDRTASAPVPAAVIKRPVSLTKRALSPSTSEPIKTAAAVVPPSPQTAAPAVARVTPEAASSSAAAPAAEFYNKMINYSLLFFVGCFGVVIYIQYRFNQKMVMELSGLNEKLAKVLEELQASRTYSSVDK